MLSFSQGTGPLSLRHYKMRSLVVMVRIPSIQAPRSAALLLGQDESITSRMETAMPRALRLETQVESLLDRRHLQRMG
jgi:hypothetical protein